MARLRAALLTVLMAVVPLCAQPVIENTPLAYTPVSSGNSIIVAKPAGLEDGDYLLAHYVSDGTGENHSGPEGWAAVFEDINTNANTGSLWIKEITDAASEPDNYTFMNGSFEALAICIARISGSSGIDDSGMSKSSNEGSFGASATASSITTVTDNSLILGFAGKDLDSPEPAVSTGGWDEEVKSGGNGIAHAIASKALASAGATGNVLWTIQDGHDWVAFQVALSPAAAGYSGMMMARKRHNRIIAVSKTGN